MIGTIIYYLKYCRV